MENVEACAGLKLLHQPTDELRVFSVINDPSSASAEKLALAFAIYFASTVSLDAAEAKLLLGQDQHTALLQFKLGLEQAFAHGDFLDRPTIAGLNALSIYVVSISHPSNQIKDQIPSQTSDFSTFRLHFAVIIAEKEFGYSTVLPFVLPNRLAYTVTASAWVCPLSSPKSAAAFGGISLAGTAEQAKTTAWKTQIPLSCCQVSV